MKGTLVKILSPGTSALSPDNSAYVERWWLATGTAVLVVGSASRRGWVRVYHDQRLFEIAGDSYSPISETPDGFDELLEAQKS